MILFPGCELSHQSPSHQHHPSRPRAPVALLRYYITPQLRKFDAAEDYLRPPWRIREIYQVELEVCNLWLYSLHLARRWWRVGISANILNSDAQKIRSDIMAKISSLKKERGTTNITSLFEQVEQTMAEYGHYYVTLGCVYVF